MFGHFTTLCLKGLKEYIKTIGTASIYLKMLFFSSNSLIPLYPLTPITFISKRFLLKYKISETVALAVKWQVLTGAYLEHSRRFKTELFEKIINDTKPLTMFTKGFILDVWVGSEYASGYWRMMIINLIRKMKIQQNKYIQQ